MDSSEKVISILITSALPRNGEHRHNTPQPLMSDSLLSTLCFPLLFHHQFQFRSEFSSQSVQTAVAVEVGAGVTVSEHLLHTGEDKP